MSKNKTQINFCKYSCKKVIIKFLLFNNLPSYHEGKDATLSRHSLKVFTQRRGRTFRYNSAFSCDAVKGFLPESLVP